MDFIEQTQELMEAFGVKSVILNEELSVKHQSQMGLYRVLNKEFDYSEAYLKMQKYYEDGTVYITKDEFEEYFISMRIPERGNSFLFIGPYMVDETEEILEKVMERHQMPMAFMKDLKEYYHVIPYIQSANILESIVITQAGYIYGGKERVQVNRIENLYGKELDYEEILREMEGKLSFSSIEERYGYEEELLNALRVGDLEKTIEYNKKLGNFQLQNEYGQGVRKCQNMLIVLNTLFRKTVQSAGVHPAHIDSLSNSMSAKIEKCTCKKNLDEVCKEMMRRYCLLVRNESLQGYSSMLRNAINYIDFHLKEPLSLKVLAAELNVNASYLSTQFKKETEKTVTDYVNEKRIKSSLIYVATTDLPIQTVAEFVGIYDENYFSRLFKKYQGMTAVQYRNLMKSN